MTDRDLARRVSILEEEVAELQELPARVAAVEAQILQLRAEMQGGFSALRSANEDLRADMVRLNAEMRADMVRLNDETRAEVVRLNGETRAEMVRLNDETRAEMVRLNGETCAQMRLLHEEVIARLALLQEGRDLPSRTRPRSPRTRKS